MTWIIGQTYPVYTKYLLPRPKFWSDVPICTKWPQTDPEHLSVKSTLYTSTYPGGPNFGPFLCTSRHFWDTKSENGNSLYCLRLSLNILETKVPCIQYVLNPETKLWSLSIYNQAFSRYKVAENRKNRKCTEWPQTDLEKLTVKSTLKSLSSCDRGPILVHFALWAGVLKIVYIFKIFYNSLLTNTLNV